ncbi:MAG: peptidoglycan DD-metalloendopeptidase family protein [Clostridia bacterium]|nr:peptidoglycan DD-metalloendopeptidase family protein [Clostridia bacterium]
MDYKKSNEKETTKTSDIDKKRSIKIIKKNTDKNEKKNKIKSVGEKKDNKNTKPNESKFKKIYGRSVAKRNRKKEILENKFTEFRPELLPNDFFNFIYTIGSIFGRAFVETFDFFKALILFTAFAIYYSFKKLYLKIGKSYLHSINAFKSELAYFNTEVKSSFKNIYSGEYRTFDERKTVFKDYVKKAFDRHPKMLKKIITVVSPVLVAVVLMSSLAYWNNVTFALCVNCNGKDIGYIPDETTYIDAKKMINESVTENDNENLNEALNDVKLKIALVDSEKLEDAKSISDKIISNSSDKITQACGVYIDGNFVCAVKNEMDAVQVFNNILEKHEEENPDDIVGFVEDIVYVQGVYEDDPTVLWDSSKLAQKLKTKRDATSVYTVEEGDTPEAVAKEHGLTLSQLEKLNPGDLDIIRVGQKIFVSDKVNYVNVKVTKTVVENAEIDFEVEKVDNPKMLKGKQQVIKKGKKGSVQITYLDTYVEGKLSSHKEVSRKILSEPVKEVVSVGTKKPSYSSNSYYGPYTFEQRGSMVWPVIGLHTVTCHFRGYYGHTGMDIAGGGNAYGKTVVAAKSGTVIAAGWENGGAGNRVLINHGGGLQTLYAHLSHINVRTGQKVSAGQAIGKVGSTGRSTGPHLHFEVRQNGRAVNPMLYF